MKKFIVSSFVLVTFIIYSILDRVLGQSGTATSIASLPTITPPSVTPSPTSSPIPTVGANTPTTSPPTATSVPKGQYKDGEYVGASTDAFYGSVQVKAIIKNGKIADVQFLDYPQDRRNSIEINSQAMPLLTQEAVQSQTANVDIVTGATATSQAFVQSLASALTQAH